LEASLLAEMENRVSVNKEWIKTSSKHKGDLYLIANVITAEQ
jgi:hypothetical protein